MIWFERFSLEIALWGNSKAARIGELFLGTSVEKGMEGGAVIAQY
jgi:hypothetical protein